ncbi:blastula protease 10-like isoform X2 [Macrobrachium nipponense]|uniref:blastula protease 10-like isoform X2 n=1 Tax=Macrobrachium nipponense TaxID=159736 RepID=UPI0030C8D127
MAVNPILSACFLGFILGLTLGQETTPRKPIILNNPPFMTALPPGNPPVFTLPGAEEVVTILKKEDLGGFENVNPSHVNGEELFEADILLSPEQKRQLLERKAISYTSMRWPNGPNGTPVVPYQFGDSVVNTTQIEAGLAHWEEHTCIDFQLITGTPPAQYLNFFKGSGCWSYVGMISTPQNVSIGDGCTSLGTVVHEVGHGIGFFHEQSRSDRDDYVTIILANVQAGKEGNFNKEVDNNYSVPYDFSSDMHYGSEYFTVNGKSTMVTKNPLAQELIGSSKGLSHYDKLLANTMYPCITKWKQNCNITGNPCQNDGYVGKNCSCVCRSGTSGANCQTVNKGYYDSLLSGCSANITAPGTVTSPNYPSNYPSGLKCVKWIQAPPCTTVQMKFNSFRLYGRNPYCGGNSCCYFDALEIRTTNLTVGDVYCDQDIANGTVFTSPSNQMILYFKTASNYYSGWSANVTFEPDPSCPSTTTSTSTTTTTSPTTTTSTTTTTPTTTSTTTTTTTSTTTTKPTTTTTSTTTTKPTTTTASTTTPSPQPQPQVRPQPSPQPQPQVRPPPSPQPQPQVRPQPSPQPQPQVRPQPSPQPQPQVRPQPSPQPQL